jgi:hypothetical protein
MIPSLGGIRLFRGMMITLCGRLTQTSMSAHGTLTENEFEVIKFIENNAPFVILLGGLGLRKIKSEENKKRKL